MIIKAINDTVESDELVLTLLVFETYSRMHAMNSSASSITQRAKIIEKAMTEVKKFRVERLIVNALNTENDSNVNSIHNLLFNSDVLIWRESTNYRDNWTESFKLLDIDDETCKIELSSDSTDFRSTVVKPFLTEDENKVQNLTRSIRAKRLPLRYQNVADIIVFLQNDQLSEGSDKLTFVESRRKEKWFTKETSFWTDHYW
jgi:hypothetical protein